MHDNGTYPPIGTGTYVRMVVEVDRRAMSFIQMGGGMGEYEIRRFCSSKLNASFRTDHE